MNTIELSTIMDDISRNTHFLVVLACDQLPKSPIHHLPASVIINTHDSSMPGEHWLATYITVEGDVCFFDSFGNNPDSAIFSPNIYKFLKNVGACLIFSNRQVQDFMSVTCGQHCIFFLYHMLRGLDYESVMSKYSENLVRNDKVVTLFVKKLQTSKCICNTFTCIQHVTRI